MYRLGAAAKSKGFDVEQRCRCWLSLHESMLASMARSFIPKGRASPGTFLCDSRAVL